MKILFGDKIFNTVPEDQSLFTSKHTKKNLRQFHIELKINENAIQSFEEQLENVFEKGAWEVDENGNKVSSFKVIKESYSYPYGTINPTYTFKLKLTEQEILFADKLIIEDVELTPYEYEEMISDDAIIIHAKVKVDKMVESRLETATEKKKYFKVVRKGINNEEILMRFGQVIWSQHDNEIIKKRIVLVEEKYDNVGHSQTRGFNYPVLENAQQIISQHISYLGKLTNLLIEKGILLQDEIDQLNEDVKEVRKQNYKYFYEVEDVDSERL